MSTSPYPVRVVAELDAGLTQERDHQEVRNRKRPLDQPQPADPDPAQRPTGEGPPAQGPGPGSTWSAGRVVALVVGSGVLLVSLGLAAAGVAVLVADRGLRQDGYLMSGEQALTSSGYALTTDTLRLEGETPADAVPERLLGSVRVTVTPRDKADVFVGVASATDVSRYLSNVAHTTVTELRPRAEGGPRYRETPGEAPSQQPHEADIWEASAAGPGPQSVVWAPRTGDWTVVVMHADGSRPVRADVSAGAELPVLKAAARVMLVLAVPGLLAGAGGLVLSLYRFRPSEPRARKSNGETT